VATAAQPQKREPEAAPPALPARKSPASVPATKPSSAKTREKTPEPVTPKTAEPGAEVVSLDSFRKKK
jgi:hypothetical protein